MPALEEILRGSLLERYLTCGHAACKCARGQRHGPVWYLTVTLGTGRTASHTLTASQAEQVRRWIHTYRRVKEHLEQISEINRELLRRQRRQARAARP